MFELVTFKSKHLGPLLEQPMNNHLAYWFNQGLAEELEITDSAVTFMINGNAMVCGGITKYWDGRGQVWSVFSEDAKNNFVPTYRAIRGWLSRQIKDKYNRIELSVACDFELGKRRAEMLGFRLECERARKYLPSGEDCALYSLVRE